MVLVKGEWFDLYLSSFPTSAFYLHYLLISLHRLIRIHTEAWIIVDDIISNQDALSVLDFDNVHSTIVRNLAMLEVFLVFSFIDLL